MGKVASNYWDEYFTEKPDEGMLDFVRSTEGFLSSTGATPSGTPLIMLDARLVPECALGYQIMVKCLLAEDLKTETWSWFVPKGAYDYEFLEQIAAEHAGKIH